MHEYSGWHWNANQKANATQADQKQDGETNGIFKIQFPQGRTQSPTAVDVHDDDDDDDDDDDTASRLSSPILF
jgi:hypothetical protein